MVVKGRSFLNSVWMHFELLLRRQHLLTEEKVRLAGLGSAIATIFHRHLESQQCVCACYQKICACYLKVFA